MNFRASKTASAEEDVKDCLVFYPITEFDLSKMSDTQATPQIHAECEMIWTQVNQ